MLPAINDQLASHRIERFQTWDRRHSAGQVHWRFLDGQIDLVHLGIGAEIEFRAGPGVSFATSVDLGDLTSFNCEL